MPRRSHLKGQLKGFQDAIRPDIELQKKLKAAEDVDTSAAIAKVSDFDISVE